MSSLKTFSLTELRSIAQYNHHKMRAAFEKAGIAPLVSHKQGVRTTLFYGQDAYDFAKKIADEKAAKKQQKIALSQERARRMALGLKVGRGYPLTKPHPDEFPKEPKKDLQQRGLFEQWSADPEPQRKEQPSKLDKVVDQLVIMNATLERLLKVWEGKE